MQLYSSAKAAAAEPILLRAKHVPNSKVEEGKCRIVCGRGSG
jgi:hypothetical protein